MLPLPLDFQFVNTVPYVALGGRVRPVSQGMILTFANPASDVSFV